MDFQLQKYSIDQLVELIGAGKLALPDFQRDFVWTPGKVAELIDSVSRYWPIGSLLLLRGPQPFEPKAISGGPAVRKKIELFILDGQQRVTALFHAIADTSDVVYFVDFEALERGDEYVRWQKRTDFERACPSLSDQANRRWAKVADVFDGVRFSKWRHSLPDDVADRMVELRERELLGLRSRVYDVVGVELRQDISLEALARIFETLNRTGVRLNAFDLMVAVLYPHEFNLREEWENACLDHKVFGELDLDGIELLKLTALWERRHQQEQAKRLTVKGVRQGDVLAVPPSRVREDWPRAVKAFESALQFSRQHLGTTDRDSIPSKAMLLTLAFLLDRSEPTAGLKSWYWSNIARQSYAQGANTRVVSDVDQAVSSKLACDWTDLDGAQLRESLQEPVRRNRLLARGIAGMLVARGACDPLSRKPLSDSRSVVFLPDSSLAAGKTSTSPETAIARQVFLDATSVKRVAVAVRQGKNLSQVLNKRCLAEQGLTLGRGGVLADRAVRSRAGQLASWLEESMGVQA